MIQKRLNDVRILTKSHENEKDFLAGLSTLTAPLKFIGQETFSI